MRACFISVSRVLCVYVRVCVRILTWHRRKGPESTCWKHPREKEAKRLDGDTSHVFEKNPPPPVLRNSDESQELREEGKAETLGPITLSYWTWYMVTERRVTGTRLPQPPPPSCTLCRYPCSRFAYFTSYFARYGKIIWQAWDHLLHLSSPNCPLLCLNALKYALH